MAKYSFLAALDNLKVDEPIGGGWKLGGSLKISNSDSVAKRLVNYHFKEQVGILEANAFFSGRPFIYGIADYPFEDESPSKQMAVIYHHLNHLQIFFQSMWLIKDNASNFNLGFLQYPYLHPLPPLTGVRVTSGGKGIYFSTAAGSTEEVTFSKSELRAALDLTKDMYGWGFEDTLFNPQPPGPQGDTNRLSRAMYFLQSARSAGSIPDKIASYCTCFETLVSTDSVELSHKVSERVAILLGKDTADCLEIYEEIKRAYDSRSRLVHGGKLNRNLAFYAEQAKKCDGYLRKLINRLINDHDLQSKLEQPREKVNTYFLHLLFSKGT